MKRLIVGLVVFISLFLISNNVYTENADYYYNQAKEHLKAGKYIDAIISLD